MALAPAAVLPPKGIVGVVTRHPHVCLEQRNGLWLVGKRKKRSAERNEKPHTPGNRLTDLTKLIAPQAYCLSRSECPPVDQPSPTLHALHLTTRPRPSQYSALHYTTLSSTPHYTTMADGGRCNPHCTSPSFAFFHQITDRLQNTVISLSESRKPPHVAHIVLFDAGPRDDACLRCF
jgi:hypothetical protein